MYKILIQSRFSSSRLPGKALMPIQSRPMLGHVVDSISQLVPKSQIVVLTSLNPADERILEFCRIEGIECRRGDEENVASRFVEVLQQQKLEYFVRISGDSPLIDHRVIEGCLELAKNSGADVATTALTRTYPSGCHVEVLRSAVFLEAYKKFSAPEHFEHVTPYFYESDFYGNDFYESDSFNSRMKFQIVELKSKIPHPQRYKFSVDTAEDLERVKQLFAAFTEPHYAYSIEEKCALANELKIFS